MANYRKNETSKMKGIKSTNMETIRCMDPERAELLDRIAGYKIANNCKPTFDITANKISFSMNHFHKTSDGEVYWRENHAILISCNKHIPAYTYRDFPYTEHEFMWVSEMPLSVLKEIWAKMRKENLTYESYYKKYGMASKAASKKSNNRCNPSKTPYKGKVRSNKAITSATIKKLAKAAEALAKAIESCQTLIK